MLSQTKSHPIEHGILSLGWSHSLLAPMCLKVHLWSHIHQPRFAQKLSPAIACRYLLPKIRSSHSRALFHLANYSVTTIDYVQFSTEYSPVRIRRHNFGLNHSHQLLHWPSMACRQGFPFFPCSIPRRTTVWQHWASLAEGALDQQCWIFVQKLLHGQNWMWSWAYEMMDLSRSIHGHIHSIRYNWGKSFYLVELFGVAETPQMETHQPVASVRIELSRLIEMNCLEIHGNTRSSCILSHVEFSSLHTIQVRFTSTID